MVSEATLFVGNVEQNISAPELEALLVELFSQCGTVVAVRIPNDGGKTKGFAFVEMGSTEQSTYATLALNGIRLFGRFIRVAWAADDEKDFQLRLENLPFSYTEIDLYEAFSRKITGIRGLSVRRHASGRSEGKATLWLNSKESTNAAKAFFVERPVYLEAQHVKVVS